MLLRGVLSGISPAYMRIAYSNFTKISIRGIRKGLTLEKIHNEKRGLVGTE